MTRWACSAFACTVLILGMCSCVTRTPSASEGPAHGPSEATGFLLAKDIAFAGDFTRDGRPVHIEGSAGKPVEVPAGTYYLSACIVEKTDSGGETWRMAGFGQDTVAAIVEQGRTSEIAFGPPLKAELAAARQGGEFHFEIAVSGRAGERYSPGVKRGSAESKPPGVEIRNAAGDLVASGRFRYG